MSAAARNADKNRTAYTANGSLPFGSSPTKIGLTATILKVIPTFCSIICYAVLYDVAIDVVSVNHTIRLTKRRFEEANSAKITFQDPSAQENYEDATARLNRLACSSHVLLQVSLCFGIVTFLMAVTGFSLKPLCSFRLPNISGFDLAFHLVATLLMAGTSLAVLVVSSHRTIINDTKRFTIAGAFGFLSAVFHGGNFVLCLILWLKTAQIH